MSPATRTFVDYLASSYRFPLALAFGAGAGVSAAVMTWFPELGKGYDPGAILLLTLGVPMVVGSAVRQMLAVTNARFGPASDFTCIAKVVEEWAGVEIRSKK